MNILKEIHNETKERTKRNAIHNNKKIVTIALTLGILSTIGFYSTGVGFFEEKYNESPLVFSFIVAGIQSVVAFLASQLLVLYILCFTKTTTLKIINAYERAHNKTVSYSINENLKQIRNDDYVSQIDEAKQGLQNKIDELKKWTQSQIDIIIQDFIRQLGLLNLKLDKSERRRINAESETVKERVLKDNAEEEKHAVETKLKKVQSELQRVSSDHDVTKERLQEFEKKFRDFSSDKN